MFKQVTRLKHPREVRVKYFCCKIQPTVDEPDTKSPTLPISQELYTRKGVWGSVKSWGWKKDATFWQTWLFFISLCFSFVVYWYDQIKGKELQFVLGSIEKIDLQKMKSTFSDLVFEKEPGNYVDLSNIEEIEVKQKKNKRK